MTQERELPPRTVFAAAAVWFIAIALAALASFHGEIGGRLTDTFHEGEYLSTRLLIAPGQTAPLLIHGAMDYLPARAALSVWGPDRIIAGTRLFNQLFGFIAAFAFLGALLALARIRREVLGALVLGGALLLWINGRETNVVTLQQGSPSTRDAALMSCLWLLLLASKRNGKSSDWAAALAGAVAAAGWAWAYNRGVLAVAAVLVYAVLAWSTGARRQHLGWLGAGALAGLAGWVLSAPELAAQHLRNILYWQANEALWYAPVPLAQVLRNMPFYLTGIVILEVALWAAWVCRTAERRHWIPRLGVLWIAAAGVFWGMFNRPDPPHLMFTVPWLALLAFASWLALTRPSEEPGWKQQLRVAAPWLAGIAALLLIDVSAMTGTSFTRPILQRTGHNIVAVLRGLPRNELLLEPRQAAVAQALRQGGGRCTYVFDNSGALYALSGLPPCSAVMLPVYASPEIERDIIADLARAAPPLVVGHSGYYNDHIDRTLAQRTPQLERWFEQNYATEAVYGGIEVRRLKGK